MLLPHSLFAHQIMNDRKQIVYVGMRYHAFTYTGGMVVMRFKISRQGYDSRSRISKCEVVCSM